MTIATVRQTDAQSRPQKKFFYKEYTKQQPKGRICIKPSRTIEVEFDHDCKCTVVWRTNGRRELKYVHKCCPIHGGGKVECEYELAH